MRKTTLLCLLLAACVVPSAPPPPSPAPSSTVAPAVESVAVMPMKAKGGANADVAAVLDDLLLTALQSTGGEKLRVIGKSDIDAVLGLEAAKDAVGCDEVTCAAELAGALGVESVIAPSVGRLGDKYILTLPWIRQANAEVLARHSETLGTDPSTFDVGVERGVKVLLGEQMAELDITGDWPSRTELITGWTETTIRFVQNGNAVAATFDANGRYEGTLNGRVLEGVWHNNLSTGRFRFTFSEDGQSYTGKYGLGSGALQYRQEGKRAAP